MALTSDQRNYYYLLETERTGIHHPILAALHQIHQQPTLTDGEVGLGISPANQVALAATSDFPGQVRYAANVIRSLTEKLANQGWTSAELWNSEKGRYTEQFIQKVAHGYAPPANEPQTARLEICLPEKLLSAYLQDFKADSPTLGEQNFGYLDRALIALIEKVPEYYGGLCHQREALLEAVRLWRGLDDREEAIASLVNQDILEESALDLPLKQFIRQIIPQYVGYPRQREALIRLTQFWRQLASREQAIASLAKNSCPEENLHILDPALIAFVQRLPQQYQGQGQQRNALTEAFRLWQQLDSRNAALAVLGFEPSELSANAEERSKLASTAHQIDRTLLEFVRRLPILYQEIDYQREALIRLVQLWRDLETRTQAVQSLFEDLKQLGNARRESVEAAPKPISFILSKRPEKWTPENIQISAAILVDGHFTWAEATCGGTRMPPNQATVDAIVSIAQLAQRARDRLGRPFFIASWYRPAQINHLMGGTKFSRHIVGDAIDFTCEGLSGNQIYWFLEPWWPGGLGRYTQFPYLCHIDARSYRARWQY